MQNYEEIKNLFKHPVTDEIEILKKVVTYLNDTINGLESSLQHKEVFHDWIKNNLEELVGISEFHQFTKNIPANAPDDIRATLQNIADVALLIRFYKDMDAGLKEALKVTNENLKPIFNFNEKSQKELADMLDEFIKKTNNTNSGGLKSFFNFFK